MFKAQNFIKVFLNLIYPEDILMYLNLISGLKYIPPLNREFFFKYRCYSVSICILLNYCSVIKKHFAKTCHAQLSVNF